MKLTMRYVKDALREVGVSCYKTGIDNEIRINLKSNNDDEATAYYTESLEDAYNTGLRMADRKTY